MKKIIGFVFLLVAMSFTIVACSGNETKTQSEQLSKDEMYTCTMHNEVMSDHAGECPKCNMQLVKQKMTDAQRHLLQEGKYVKPKE